MNYDSKDQDRAYSQQQHYGAPPPQNGYPQPTFPQQSYPQQSYPQQAYPPFQPGAPQAYPPYQPPSAPVPVIIQQQATPPAQKDSDWGCCKTCCLACCACCLLDALC
ncbi:hypothetical protein GGI19_005447 [Coemansia pectinata]|uniref:Cysteine-rich transmembrane CYSTM domain-containing protein n=1 Tax=Coemansia pectinata TaxID=1052879 RepID=A0A9W8L9K3_9FUNG|nr:hypothetical protein GGI19_005447 [Coemansia pectinata]